jgi:hypothetical protein
VTATLPPEVQSVFERFRTTELTTIDDRGQPITWPVSARYRAGAPCIDITTDRAPQARANTQVGLLFCDSGGSGLQAAPMVLVQGTAHVGGEQPGEIRVRPERVYVWPDGQPDAEPVLYDAHMEEVRSGHSEEPERFHADPEGGPSAWDGRLDELRDASAILSVVSPDGFPFSARVRVSLDAAARWIEIAHAPTGLPFAPGRACLATDDPDAIQVRGDLVRVEHGWALIPHSIRDDHSGRLRSRTPAPSRP